MEDPRQLLSYALATYPERLEIAPVDQLIMEMARQNAKRPAYLKLAVPDELIKQLRGQRDRKDLVLLVRVPREVQDRAESLIVLPSEASGDR